MKNFSDKKKRESKTSHIWISHSNKYLIRDVDLVLDYSNNFTFTCIIVEFYL